MSLLLIYILFTLGWLKGYDLAKMILT